MHHPTLGANAMRLAGHSQVSCTFHDCVIPIQTVSIQQQTDATSIDKSVGLTQITRHKPTIIYILSLNW